MGSLTGAVTDADLDGDGDADLVLARSLSPGILWLENTGQQPPGFGVHILDAPMTDVDWLEPADMDGDGATDLLAVSGSSGTLVLYTSNGASPPAFRITRVSADVPGVQRVLAADLNADGRRDMITCSTTDGRVTWFRQGRRDCNGNGLPDDMETIVPDTPPRLKIARQPDGGLVLEWPEVPCVTKYALLVRIGDGPEFPYAEPVAPPFILYPEPDQLTLPWRLRVVAIREP